MAYRRSLTTSARLVARQRFAPSFCCPHVYEEDDRKDERVEKSFVQSRSYGNKTNSWRLGFGGMSFGGPKPMTTNGFLLARRNMSISAEVVAAAGSSPPVAALQCAIDGIHTYSGLNWWASIVVTTLAIKTLSIPLMINELKVSEKLKAVRPELARIKKEVQDRGMSPALVAEGQEWKKRVYKEYGVTHLTPLRGIFIRVSVYGSLFLAIQNMVEKVPSLQTGGISWFIDITAADSFYIIPFLGAFSFWAMAESNMPKGAPVTAKLKMRGLSALTFPLAASVPTALLFYWITFNLSSLVCRLILENHSVQKLLNITKIQQQPQSLALASALKALNSAAAKATQQRPGTITHQTITSQSDY